MDAQGMQIVNDGQWINGLDSINYTIGTGSYQWAQNIVNRGGMAQTRQGLAEIAAVLGKDPRGGGIMVIAGVTWLLAAIGENIYKLNLNSPSAGLVMLNYPNGTPVRFPVGSRRMVHFELCVRAQKAIRVGTSYETREVIPPQFVMIIQDGAQDPHYWDGTTCDKVDNHPDCIDTIPNNTPKATFMKWIGDRLWTVSGRKMRASNLLNPFQNTEELITASGGFFFLPDNATGMGVTHDYKSLLVFTHFTTSAFQVGIENRTEWGNTQDFQRLIFPSIGCVAHRTIINMYGMTWWMAHDGWVGLDNTLSAFQTSKLDVQDQNMSRSKEGVSWTQGGGCAGSYGNFLFVSVPSGNKWNQHTWVMDQAPINTIAGTAPPVWCSNWTGIRPEQWFTCQIAGHQRCFCISRDLVDEGHQATVWEAFIGQRMDVPKVDGNRKAKDIGCAFETRFIGLSPSQYARLRWIELDCAEIIGDVKLQVYYCGRRTSYKQIINTHLTSTISPSTEEVFNEEGVRVYVPQFRTIRSFTDVHTTTDNNPEIQTGRLRNIDREFSALVTWSGQMAVTAIRFALDPEPDYLEGGDNTDEYLSRRITAEGEGFIGCTRPEPNAPTGAVTSQFIAPLKPRWVEFPAYDSAVPNGVFFVAELTASPPPGAYPSNLYPIDVTLTSETQGIDIYYTRNGQNPRPPPNQVGTHYPPKPAMSLGQRLKAIGVREGMQNSVMLNGLYTQSQVAPVTFNPVATTYAPDEFPVEVRMNTMTGEAIIRYVINESPSPAVGPNSPRYFPNNPPEVGPNKYLHAKAFLDNYLPSVETIGRYIQRLRCVTPTCTPDGGAYPVDDYNGATGMAVVMQSTTAGAALRYTINDPDVETGTVATNPKTIHVHPDDVVRVIAQKADRENSHTKTATYTTSREQVETPTITPNSVVLMGNHHEKDVRVECATPNVTCSYTISQAGVIDIPTPTHGTLVNDNDFMVHVGPPNNRIGHRVLRVIAFRTDMDNSDVAEATFDHENEN